ncbi:MarR family winged helix-turn-helix transcriptional regulator [Phytoactinopolyspora halotolerans]|uniref:MarR family transcriptional regulator n=1 Tax=Phytoactinopolyspora halotolerans TaxID=1981512 RepID=A0A6L9SFN2_9ACTN|nr:MarR family transcriptional regulator [Phytoactinopolyspora halotolerans]NEE02870.1 MarR family transcriptional regulator [Phytoactinopolyspora halotolerans]
MQEDEVDRLIATIPDDLTDTELLTVELAKRIGLIGRLFQDAVQGILDELNLTHAEFEVLAALRRAGEPYRRKPRDLARDLVLTSGGISNVLLRLETAGLIRRTPDPDDARGRHVELTAAGLEKARDAVRGATQAQVDAMTTVPPATARAAADALRDVSLSLRAPRRL